MKKSIISLVSILLLLAFSIIVKAQSGTPGMVTSFTLKTGSTAADVIAGTGGNGYALIVNSTGTTSMEWKCTIAKLNIGQGTETFFMKLVYKDQNNVETDITTPPEQIFTYQYNSSGFFYFTKLNVPLPSGLVGGKIYVKYFTNFEGYPAIWSYSNTYFVPTLPPPPITYSNTSQSGYFFRNNCGVGNQGSGVSYVVPANTYTSTISQANANQAAQNDINTNGQTYANINGLCTPGYVVTPTGTGSANWGYEENISWYSVHFQGSSVKIEVYESLDNGNTDVFYKLVTPSTSNNGFLQNALNTNLFTPLQGGWGSIYYKIKITSLATGISYFSNYFAVTND